MISMSIIKKIIKSVYNMEINRTLRKTIVLILLSSGNRLHCTQKALFLQYKNIKHINL